MNFALEIPIFCHALVYPPTHSRGSSIELKLVKSVGSFDIKRIDTESSHLVTIPSGHNLGFTSGEQRYLENEIKNFVLALNLTLNRACVTNRKGDFPPYKVTSIPPKSKVSVTKLDNGSHIHIKEYLAVRDEAHISVGFTEGIEEKMVVQIFQKIQRLKRFKKKNAPQLGDINLDSALSLYENGIFDFDPLFKFKHFFNSLELIVNMEGKDKTGSSFDNEVVRISSASSTEAMNWREFYNRTKHVQKGSNDLDEYYGGINTLSEKLQPIRTNLNGILLSKLQ